MKLLTIFFFLLFSTIGFTQNTNNLTLEIDFIETYKEDSVNTTSQIFHKLYHTPRNSKFLFVKVVNQNFKDNAVNFEPEKSSKGITMIKDYNKSTISFQDLVSLKLFSVQDSLNIFNWLISTEKKEILGYQCSLAEGEFRGRKYKVWFTQDLPQGGPWKFDGLPGMILKVKSTDGYISYEAVKLKYIKDYKFVNPFPEDEQFLNWDEMKALYKKKAINDSKYSIEDGNFTVITPRIKTERYIEEDDKDYTADKEFYKIKNESENVGF